MKVLTAVFLIIITSCAQHPHEKSVRSRAAYDFNCPESKIKVSNISAGNYGAQGCNKKRAYVCIDMVCKKD